MTSTRSAAAAGLPSNRRSFLGALVAVTIASGSALAASIPLPANDPHPDAEIAEMESGLTAARSRLRELDLLCDEAYEAAEQIPIPANLFCMSNDWIFLDPSGVLELACAPNGKIGYTYATDGVAEIIRDKIAEWRAMPLEIRRWCGIDRKIARAEEIVAGVEAWEADSLKARIVAGCDIADCAYEDQKAVVDELSQRVALAQAESCY